jgi:hypothetical protein
MYAIDKPNLKYPFMFKMGLKYSFFNENILESFERNDEIVGLESLGRLMFKNDRYNIIYQNKLKI